MSSLLKYRFMKKENDKLPSDGLSQESSVPKSEKLPSDDGPSQESNVSGAGSSQTLSLTSAPSQTPNDSHSPSQTPDIPLQSSATSEDALSNGPSAVVIAPIKQEVSGVSSKRGALVIGSDSETDSPIKAGTPWLISMQSSIRTMTANQTPATNGHQSASVTLSCSTQGQTQEYKDEQRELYSNLAVLQDIYPQTPRPKLVEALASSDNNVEAAIDWIIANQGDGGGRKRTFQRIQSEASSDEDSVPRQPPHKKARPIESSESQDDELDLESKIKFLSEAFPLTSREVLLLTLKSKDYSLEKASDALSTSGLYPLHRGRPSMKISKTTALSPSSSPSYIPKTPPSLTHKYPPRGAEAPTDPPRPLVVSPTENVGSIKAYQAARIARQTEGAENSTVKAGTNKDRNIFSLYSNDTTSAAAVDSDEDEEAEYSGESDSDADDTPSDPIINFLNEATVDELVAMDGCSKKKAEILAEIRPFDGWEELLGRLGERSKELNFNVIGACKDMLHMRSVVHKLMMKCQKIATNMEYIVSELTGITNLEDSLKAGRYLTQQPDNLSDGMKLKPYQMVGVNWLYLMHRQGLDGILGDEMGLGKTIQTIAFLAQLLQDGNKGPHVIIVPSSTIDNWLRELHVWCPALKVALYYGSQEDRRFLRQQLLEDGEEFHVIVTTYNMASGSVEDRILFKKFQFYYSVFDEGHMLKNMTSMRYQALMKIKASRRLLLTGTPLQNNLVELMSLLAFVMPDMFCGKTDHIKKIFTTISSRSNYETKGEYERQTISQAKSILKPFFLRRLKREVLQQLPQKTDIIEKVSLAYEQADLYDSLRSEFNRKLQEEKAANSTVLKSSGSAMLMQLRKAANHQLLHRKLYDETKLRTMAKLMLKEPTHREANLDYVFEDMEVMSDFELHHLCLQYKNIRKFCLEEDQILDTGKFRYLDNLLPQCKQQGDRVLLFSQFTMMLDIIEDYLKARGHIFIRLDGQTPVAERQDLIDRYNSETEIFVFLLSTKAGGLGINLTAANTVILHDIDFNPYNDKQAEDRCHRVGQTRDVTIYRLVSKNTVEEAMLRCAQAKLQLEQDVTGQTEAKDTDTPNDVASLLHEALSIETDN